MEARDLEKSQGLILDEWRRVLFGEKFRAVREVREYLNDCTGRIVSCVVRILSGKRVDGLENALDDFLRYLATDKNIGPGEAVMSILKLKEIIFNLFPRMSLEEYRKLDRVMDEIASISFDIYSSLREELFELRLMEKEKEKRMLERSIELTLEDQKFYDSFRIRR
jgi:hypothetical protein